MESIETLRQKLVPIFDKEPIIKVTLFDSYVKGDHDELSDVDLVIDVDLFEQSEIVRGSPNNCIFNIRMNLDITQQNNEQYRNEGITV